MGLANDQTQLRVPQMGIGVTHLKKIRKRGLGISHLEKIRLQKRSNDDDDDVHNNTPLPPVAVSPDSSLYRQMINVSSMPNPCNPAATVSFLPGMMSSSNDEINLNGKEIFHYYDYPHMTLPPPTGPPPSLMMHQFQSRPAMNIHQMHELPSNQSLYVTNNYAPVHKHQEQDKMILGKKRSCSFTLDNMHTPSFQPSLPNYDSRKQFQVNRENSVASRNNFLTHAMSSSTSAANHPSIEIPHLQYLPCKQEDSEPCRQKRRKLPYYDFLPLNKAMTVPSTVNKRSKNKSSSKEETQQNIDLTLKL